MSKFLTWVGGFFSELAPGSSSTRLIMIAGTLIPLAVWTGLSVYHLALQSIPESVLVFVSMALGIKALHKGFETRAQVAAIEKDKPVAADVTNVGAAVTVEPAQ